MSSTNEKEVKKTKEEYMKEFIKAIATADAEMQPYKDHKKDLKKSYIENGHLTKSEMKNLLKAYSYLKNDEDIDELVDVYNKIK